MIFLVDYYHTIRFQWITFQIESVLFCSIPLDLQLMIFFGGLSYNKQITFQIEFILLCSISLDFQLMIFFGGLSYNKQITFQIEFILLCSISLDLQQMIFLVGSMIIDDFIVRFKIDAQIDKASILIRFILHILCMRILCNNLQTTFIVCCMKLLLLRMFGLQYSRQFLKRFVQRYFINMLIILFIISLLFSPETQCDEKLINGLRCDAWYSILWFIVFIGYYDVQVN
eukprot:TRINITY_DN7484_c0_g1_i2.p1 TRINITY_DN7484_c0_g1~~TRINITY_DN7484_c0_g1_i2.p1  ORF type:complete len:228 (-),score=-5.74 TRINITY_DN7484_c0_g1_i2:49-732(-)